MPNLIDRSKVSLRLVGCAFQVIQRHTKLLVFPAVVFACVVVVTLFFAAPLTLLPTGHPLGTVEHWTTLLERIRVVFTKGGYRTLQGSAFVYAAFLYLVAMVVATFVNVAFYHEIMRALAGETVSLRRGLVFAWGKIRAILLWSLLAATVGLVIQLVSERLGWVGRWVMRVVGIAWSVASMFAIPAMIRDEESNPFAVLRNSAATLKRSWGEAVAGYVGLKAGTMLVILAWFIFIALTMVMGSFMGKMGALIMLLALLGGIFGPMVIFYLSTVANSIYICALYVYASEGVVPEPFTAAQMDAAWKVKKTPAV